MRFVKLTNNVEVPIVGYGTSRYTKTAKINDDECKNCIKHALEIGYRHIDTAKHYKNEHLVRKAIQESKIKRNEIFITSKLYPSDMGYENTLKSFEQTCKQLHTDYLDLYLIHFPALIGKKQTYDEAKKLRLETWLAFEHLYKEGKCRAIGVSNYLKHHIEEIFEANMLKPHVNQCEFHPYFNNKELFDYCKKNEILFEGYCPLAKGAIISDDNLISLANKYSKTPAQIAIQWSLQNDVITIPCSWNYQRIEENLFDEFTLEKEDFELLWSLDKNLKCSWNPLNVF